MVDFMTIEEVATLMHVSKKTVINLIERGRFPEAYQIDPDNHASIWRIPIISVNAHLAKQGKPPVVRNV